MMDWAVVKILVKIHAREDVSATWHPVDLCCHGYRTNTKESSSSAERQVKLWQLISQDLADEISKDVQDSLSSPNDFIVECVTMIRQLLQKTKRIPKHVSTNQLHKCKNPDENCLSVDQHLHSHPAPWWSSTPHILWIRRPIQVKHKHEHKTGQCAPIQLHSTQNDAAWSLAAAANSSCCIIRPVPQPSMPNYCPLILSRHEDKLWRGRSSAHTVSDKCVRK